MPGLCWRDHTKLLQNTDYVIGTSMLRRHMVCCIYYADGAVIFLAEDEKLMRQGLEVLMEWCDEWTVEVNVEKSGAMHMRRKGGGRRELYVRGVFMLVARRKEWWRSTSTDAM